LLVDKPLGAGEVECDGESPELRARGRGPRGAV
jgi:hypothetical protein